MGRPVKRVESGEGLYVDEEGEAYQLAQGSSRKPLAVKIIPLGIEELRSASDTAGADGEGGAPSLGTSAIDSSDEAESSNPDKIRPKTLLRRPRRKKQLSIRDGDKEHQGYDATGAELLAHTVNGPAVQNCEPANALAANPVTLNLHQKLAEVRRRIGYVQKRGRNERFNYSYVTAADIAGAVGDILSQLGVVVVPSLESISYEPVRTSNGQVERVAHVVMTYTFTDVDTAEAVTVKVPGEGLDIGDKAPYKAMTGALKYALLQSFLLATGDDPEEERITPCGNTPPERASDRAVSAEEACELRQLIDDTGTELERVLTYYKLSTLEEMTEGVYRRAMELLNRKHAAQSKREANHAQG
jgi:hypothetical protein